MMETDSLEPRNGASQTNVRRLYIFSAFAALGWLATGNSFTSYNSTINYISKSMDWPQDQGPFRQGLGYALFPGGALMILLIIIWKFSNSSRKMLLIVADIFTITGAILTTIPIFWVFIIGRLFLGFGFGINGPIISVYLRETSPPSLSGKMGSAAGIESQCGKLLGFILAFGLTVPPTAEDSFWQIMYLVPAIVSILRILCLTFYYTDDTPKYYVLHGQEEKAKNVIEKTYETEEARLTALEKIKAEHSNEKDLSLGTLFVKYRTQVFLCIMLAAFAHLTGQQTVTAYSTSILTASSPGSNVDPDKLRKVSLINLVLGITKVLSALFAGFFLDRFGRKPLFILGVSCTASGLIILALALQYDILMLAGFMILLLSAGSALGFGVTTAVYLSEVLPASGNNLMLAFDNAMNLVVNFAFPILASIPGFGFPGVLFVMGGIGVLGIICVMKFVVETKGLSMYEIYEVFDKINKKQRKGIKKSSLEAYQPLI